MIRISIWLAGRLLSCIFFLLELGESEIFTFWFLLCLGVIPRKTIILLLISSPTFFYIRLWTRAIFSALRPFKINFIIVWRSIFFFGLWWKFLIAGLRKEVVRFEVREALVDVWEICIRVIFWSGIAKVLSLGEPSLTIIEGLVVRGSVVILVLFWEKIVLFGWLFKELFLLRRDKLEVWLEKLLGLFVSEMTILAFVLLGFVLIICELIMIKYWSFSTFFFKNELRKINLSIIIIWRLSIVKLHRFKLLERS